jgi:hypothetical protein
VVFDGDLHVVIDAGPPQGAGESGVFIRPDHSIRRHAPGLPRETFNESTFQPIEIDVFKKISPRLGVNDHEREHTLREMGLGNPARRTDNGYAPAQ